MTGTGDIAFWKAAAQSSPDVLLIVDQTGTILFASDRVQSLLGWTPEELAGKPLAALIPGPPAARLENISREQPVRAKNGGNVEVEVTRCPMSVPGSSLTLLSLRTPNPRHRLEFLDMEAQLAHSMKATFQSEKLAAIGQLAAGVAHEINNPLGVILGFAQAMARRIEEDNPFAPPLKSIEREALRCKTLVAQLLSFSRQDAAHFCDLDLGEALEGALLLVETQARLHSVAISYKCVGPNLAIKGDSNQIQQVVINLCSNAVDAMPGGGTLTVGAGMRADKPGFVEIRIEDTGSGIPADIRSRIFDPFFTTKEAGKGTGLGLALVQEIVSRHGGGIQCDSVPGKGTIFRVSLPLTS